MDTTTTDIWGQPATVGRGASTSRVFGSATVTASASAHAPAWHRTTLVVNAMPTVYGVKPAFNGIPQRPSEGSS